MVFFFLFPFFKQYPQMVTGGCSELATRVYSVEAETWTEVKRKARWAWVGRGWPETRVRAGVWRLRVRPPALREGPSAER